MMFCRTGILILYSSCLFLWSLVDGSDLQPPVIDISPLFASQQQGHAISEVRKQMLTAAKRWGFFYVTNHGIDETIINSMEHEMKSFFSLPKDIKYQIKRNEHNSRGYADDELTKQLVDLKEIYDIGQLQVYTNLSIRAARDQAVDGVNYWLPDKVLPNLKPVIETYYEACYGLSSIITQNLIESLDCAPNTTPDSSSSFFQEHFTQHSSFLRLNYYPAQSSTGEEEKVTTEATIEGENQSVVKKSTLGISRHTDAGALTILWQDPAVTSLEVYSGTKQDADDGEWVPIDPIPHTLTVNIGDMLQVWSNNQLKAAEHRVRASRQVPRYSMAYFLNPSYDSLVSPWICGEDSAVEEEKTMTKYQAIRWGSYRTQRYQGDFADVGKEIQIEEFIAE